MTAGGDDPPTRDRDDSLPARDIEGDSSDAEIADTADELATVLEALRDELRDSRRRGPFGLPAPPTPGELLRFTDDYAIPFAIAVLEANIRALRLLQGAIRLVDAGDRAREDVKSTRDRAISFSQSTLSRLDDVLSKLEESAAEEGNDETFPRNPEARSILSEARALRRELTDALGESTRAGESTASTAGDEPSDAADDGPTTIPIRDGSRSDSDDGETDSRPADQSEPSAVDGNTEESTTEVNVDVEGELQSIKEQLGKVDTEPSDDAAGVDDPDSTEEGDEQVADGETAGGDTDGESAGDDTDGESADGDTDDETAGGHTDGETAGGDAGESAGEASNGSNETE